MAETVAPIGFEDGEHFQFTGLDGAPEWVKEFGTMTSQGIGLALPRRKFGQPYSPETVRVGDTVWTNKNRDEFLIQRMPGSPQGFPVSRDAYGDKEEKLSDDPSTHNQLVGQALEKMGNIPTQGPATVTVYDPVDEEEKTVANPDGVAAEEARKAAREERGRTPSAPPEEEEEAKSTRRRRTTTTE